MTCTSQIATVAPRKEAAPTIPYYLVDHSHKHAPEIRADRNFSVTASFRGLGLSIRRTVARDWV